MQVLCGLQGIFLLFNCQTPVQARIPKVVIGAMNPKAGCAGSVLNILQTEGFNHQTEIETGILGEECSEMMSEFFRELRKKKKKAKAAEKEERNKISG